MRKKGRQSISAFNCSSGIGRVIVRDAIKLLSGDGIVDEGHKLVEKPLHSDVRILHLRCCFEHRLARDSM